MRTFAFIVAGLGCAIAFSLVACNYAPNDEDLGGSESAIDGVDPLEGAYVKQGGTPVHFVFKRGDKAEEVEDSFFGEIDVDGDPQRAEGTVTLARDGLGTKFTLTPTGAAKATVKDAGRDGTTPGDAGADAGAKVAVDDQALAQQAFSGTMHFLRIGQNNTILVRADENGKTAQYKKIKSWCGSAGDDDCDPSVQSTSLECGANGLVCTTKHQCVCGE